MEDTLFQIESSIYVPIRREECLGQLRKDLL